MVTRMTEKTQEEISKRTYATVRAMARDILEFDLLILPFGAFGLVVRRVARGRQEDTMTEYDVVCPS